MECEYCFYQYATQEQYDNHLDGVHRSTPGGAILPGSIVDKVAAVPDLDTYKDDLCYMIDQETLRRVFEGFEYPALSGNKFSMSERAQINWLGLLNNPDLPTYPLSIATKDNKVQINLANAAEATTFGAGAYGFKANLLIAGNVIKANVRAAVDTDSAWTAAENYLAGL